MIEFGLEPFILEDLRSVLKEYPKVESAAIFGSRATGEYRYNSDIDIAVFAPSMDKDEFARLWFDLDDLPIVFGMDIVHFDLVNNPVLKEKIVRDGKIFYPPTASVI